MRRRAPGSQGLTRRRRALRAALDRALQLGTGAEARDPAGGDLDLLSGLRVYALTGAPVCHGELPETGEVDLSAARQHFLKRLENCVDGLGRLALPKPAPVCDAVDELILGHDFPPCRGQLTGRNVTTHPDESSLDSAPRAETAAYSEPFRCLGARNCHFPDKYRGGLDTAAEGHPTGLGSHGTHRFQHGNEVAGDGQLAHRTPQLTPLDEPSGGSDGECSRHRIDPGMEPSHVRHVEPVAGKGGQAGEVYLPRL